MSLLQPLRDYWHAHPRAIRELALLVGSLVFGILVMPLIIHAIGREALGAYASGGASALFGDFFRGLASGAKAFWAVALGPYVFLLLLRWALAVIRRQRVSEIEV